MLVRPQGLLCLIERADPIVVRFAARPVRKLTPSALPAAPPVTFAERVPCVATVSAAVDGGQHRLSMNLSPSSDELGRGSSPPPATPARSPSNLRRRGAVLGRFCSNL